MANNPSVPGCNTFSDPGRIVDGQHVNEFTINPIIDQLFENDLYVKGILDYFQMPSALIACVEIDPVVQVGQPVYYSNSSGRYELSGFGKTVIAGRTYLNDSAEVWGLLVRKDGNDQGLMLVDGIYPVDLTASYGEAVAPGRLYLGLTAGTLVDVPPDDSAPIYVATGTADGNVLFRPWTGENNGVILQWKHELQVKIAGAGVISDGRGVISSPDNSQVGWLPAGNVAFGGNAPPGAVFGYNIAADEELAAKWPPRFLKTAHLDFDRAIDPTVGGTSVPLGSEGLAIVDEHGIWWMGDCVDDLPFHVGPFAEADASGCPRIAEKRLTLYAARPAGPYLADLDGENHTTIKSLHPALEVLRRGSTTLAEVGDLDLTLNLSALLGDTDDNAAVALKRISGNKITQGPVLSGISAGPGVNIEGDTYGDEIYYGDIIISATGTDKLELLPQSTALRKATEEQDNNSLGIGLPRLRNSGFTSMFQVPLAYSGDVKLRFRMWTMPEYFSGGGSGAAEQLNVTYRILEQPAPATELLSMASQGLPIPSSPAIDKEVTEQISDSFIARGGDVIYIDVDRPSRALPYDMQVLKHFLYVDQGSVAGNTTTSTSTTAAPAVTTTTTAAPGVTTTTTAAGTTTTTAAGTTTTTAAPTTTTTEAPAAFGIYRWHYSPDECQTVESGFGQLEYVDDNGLTQTLGAELAADGQLTCYHPQTIKLSNSAFQLSVGGIDGTPADSFTGARNINGTDDIAFTFKGHFLEPDGEPYVEPVKNWYRSSPVSFAEYSEGDLTDTVDNALFGSGPSCRVFTRHGEYHQFAIVTIDASHLTAAEFLNLRSVTLHYRVRSITDPKPLQGCPPGAVPTPAVLAPALRAYGPGWNYPEEPVDRSYLLTLPQFSVQSLNWEENIPKITPSLFPAVKTANDANPYDYKFTFQLDTADLVAAQNTGQRDIYTILFPPDTFTDGVQQGIEIMQMYATFAYYPVCCVDYISAAAIHSYGYQDGVYTGGDVSENPPTNAVPWAPTTFTVGEIPAGDMCGISQQTENAMVVFHLSELKSRRDFIEEVTLISVTSLASGRIRVGGPRFGSLDDVVGDARDVLWPTDCDMAYTPGESPWTVPVGDTLLEIDSTNGTDQSVDITDAVVEALYNADSGETALKMGFPASGLENNADSTGALLISVKYAGGDICDNYSGYGNKIVCRSLPTTTTPEPYTVQFALPSSANLAEGGSRNISITASEAVQRDVVVNLVQSGGTAVQGVDYLLNSSATLNQLVIPANALSVNLGVYAMPSDFGTPDVTLELSIASVEDGFVGPQSTHNLTINRSTTPTTTTGAPTTTTAAPTTTTTAPGTSAVSFDVTNGFVTQGIAKTITVNCTPADGASFLVSVGFSGGYVRDVDFVAGGLDAQGRLLIPAGQTSADFTITPAADLVPVGLGPLYMSLFLTSAEGRAITPNVQYDLQIQE